MAWSA